MSLLGWRHAYGLMTVVGFLLSGSGALVAKQASLASARTTDQSASIHGLVVNAGTNRPLARALVQVEGHAVLTGSDGKFEFTGLVGPTTTVRATKPGFYEGLDPYETAAKSVAVGSSDAVEIKLYPEALITGSILEASGDPLTQIQVQALRRVDDESGSRWTMSGQASTNVDGQFRLPLPGGDYVIETQYMPERFGAHGAVLPMISPAAGASGAGGASVLRLASGSEQHLDLHPPVRPSHEVHLQIEGAASGQTAQGGSQIQVHLANGLTFSPTTHAGERQGEVVVNLPNGSYLVSANGGGQNGPASYGETTVIVADEDVAGATIHLQKALEVSIEASVDPAAAESGSTPSSTGAIDPGSASFAQQLGMFFQRADAGATLRTENVSPMAQRGGPPSFTLMPGSYRLRSAGYSPWYIESATIGGTDLLTQDLVVDGGSSPVPLRVVVSNQTATVKGTTKASEQPAACYVYLIASAPSATPVIRARSGSDGSFSRGQIPPGTYRVVALETRVSFDLTDPSVQRQLAPSMKTVTVAQGETGTVDLDAASSPELKP